jgi:DNA repair protein RecO (recombination protein O)
MRWADDGIFLVGRPPGEKSVIADIFTRSHGRVPGLVKGGRSRQLRPLLQTGNELLVDWRARLDDQLGVYTAELVKATAARLLDDKLALAGVTALASLLLILPERDPHPKLFEAAAACLSSAASDDFPVIMIRFELTMLDELGFGLDLSRCAATGSTHDLVYVSPKSGQAVSRAPGEPYRDKLLRLPDFMKTSHSQGLPPRSDLIDGLTLTGYFLAVHVFGETNRPLPKARDEFVRLLQGQK